MENKAKPTLNPALKDFWLTKARNKVLYGGRASSKSWDTAGFAIYLANNYKLRFLCARQIQNKIDESVYTLLKTQIYRFGLAHNFEILKNKIINTVTGSEFVFYGLWRNIEEIKSLEGIDVCWIEEAHALTQAQWDILEPTIRKEGSEFWIVFNPKFATDFIYQKFVINTPPNTVKRLINYTENPFLSNTLLKIIEQHKSDDYDSYCHVYLGQTISDNDLSIIKRSWVMAAVDAHIKLGFEPVGIKVTGYDVADDGEDKNAIAYRHGSVLLGIDEWQADIDELLISNDKAFFAYPPSDIVYDSIGVGASAGARFKELNNKHGSHRLYYKFNAAQSVSNPKILYGNSQVTNEDMFSNLKAQAWWELAERFKNTYNAIMHGHQFSAEQLISLSGAIDTHVFERLASELCSPKKDSDSNSRFRVESKKDMAKRGIKSPNLADAVVMAFSHHLVVNHKIYASAGLRTY